MVRNKQPEDDLIGCAAIATLLAVVVFPLLTYCGIPAAIIWALLMR